MQERRCNRSTIPIQAMEKQLQAIVQAGGFRTALISDNEGLIIAASSGDPINDSLGVLGVQLFQKKISAKETEDKLYILRQKKGNQSLIMKDFRLLDQPVYFLALSERTDGVTKLIKRAITGAIRILES